MAHYNVLVAAPNGQTLFDVFTRTGSGSNVSSLTVTNSDGTITTIEGTGLTWNGTTATAGTVTSIVRKNAAGTVIYDQITGFAGGPNNFVDIWNPSGQASRAGYIFMLADQMTGSAGNDFFRGYKGDDLIDGGLGSNDMVAYDNDSGQGGTGAIIVNLSATTQYGVAAISARDGWGNIDTLVAIEEARGGNGNDTFVGGSGYSYFQGRGGSDTYIGGNTVAYFGNNGTPVQFGWNWVDYRNDGGANGASVTLTNGTATPGVEGVGSTGGTAKDSFGNTESLTDINAIRGGTGNDSVAGNSFFNVFEGLGGNDTFDGGNGIDRYKYSNEGRFGGSLAVGVKVNLSDAAVTVNGVTYGAHGAIDSFGNVDVLLGVEQIEATNQSDMVYGNDADNDIWLYGGDDLVYLGNGFDYVEPGAGNDTIDGTPGSGIDQAYDDADELSYDDFGTNGVGIYIDLNAGKVIDPTGGVDIVIDMERLRGTSSADVMIGSDFSNQRQELFRGLAGNDTIDGRNGYDIVDYAKDASYGGKGGIIANLSSAAVTSNGITVQAGTIRDGFGHTDRVYYIEAVRGTDSADVLVGNASVNQFRVRGGNDTVDGGAGLDRVEMYVSDTFTGSGAIVNLSAGDVTVDGVTVAASTARSISGGVSQLISIEDASGSTLADVIYGSAGANSINGFFGNDTLYGGDGDDKLNGGQGSNVIDGGDGFDFASFMYDPTEDDYYVTMFPGNGFVLWGGVSVNLATNSAIGYDGSASQIFNVEGVTGTFFGDSLVGNAGDNKLRGMSGNDTLDGGTGNDTVLYNPTNDDGRTLVPILGVNYSQPNGIKVNLSAVTVEVSDGTLVAAGTALDGEGGVDTLISIENVVGSIGDDEIAASAVANRIDGRGGFDVVGYDGAFDDYTVTAVNGGWQVARKANGADTDYLRDVEQLYFIGADQFVDLTAQGLVEAGDGASNEIVGAQGSDSLDAGGGDDYVEGGMGNDTVLGGEGADEIVGGDGNDQVDGGLGNDVLVGGTGHGDDTYTGGDGADTVVYTSTSKGITVALATLLSNGSATGAEIDTDVLISIENVIAGDGNDTVTGNVDANQLVGGAGNDVIFGLGGIDTLEGGSGDDRIDGGAGDDALYGDSDNDVLTGGEGADYLDGGANTDTGGDMASYLLSAAGVTVDLSLGTGSGGDAVGDTLAGIEGVTGSAYADLLTGSSGANQLIGGAGNDTLTGGAGADTLDGGLGVDTAGYGSASSGVTVYLDGSQANTGDALGDGLVGIENLSGSGFDDKLTGDANANTLTGGAGNDTLIGGDGNDVLYGDAADSLDGGAGYDIFYTTSTAFRGYGMAAANIEQMIATENGNTVTVVRNVDGTIDEATYDTANTQSYNFYANHYNSSWQLYLQQFIDDNGNLRNLGYDLANTDAFQYYQNTYDSQNHLLTQQIRDDNGQERVVGYDVAGTQTFQSYVNTYDTQGRLILQQILDDNGNNRILGYDVDNLYSWAYYQNTFNPAGTMIDSYTVADAPGLTASAPAAELDQFHKAIAALAALNAAMGAQALH